MWCILLTTLIIIEASICDINENILISEKNKTSIDIYEKHLIEKQIQILKKNKINYKKLNNINYVKYFLPLCIQPKTNNTDKCLSERDVYMKNFKKKNILRELHVKKRLTEYRINQFIEKYTGKFLKNNVLHKQISKIYNNKSKIEIFIKGDNFSYNRVIGDIAFFDSKPNVLLENVKYIVRKRKKKKLNNIKKNINI
ncbi:hypothetical protein PFHG_04854 [Plasmodium falciparum HB3]|uniref:Uncharacterized protein n=1 Tax=Plasmodium falciparum (isolate HB3) TaxID=137071 RepID=A0A0L7KI80_PLAFX|nr:hypothetical protein PFHG_04854 [Plasmodium falciparum HB3]